MKSLVTRPLIKPCQSSFTSTTRLAEVTSEKRGRAVILAASPQLKPAVGAGMGTLGEMFLILGVK
jgi:hypothetical protein